MKIVALAGAEALRSGIVNPFAGIGVGIALGVAMAFAGEQRRRQREREIFEELLTQGDFRLLRRDGQAALPSDLLEALQAGARGSISTAQRNRMILAGFVVALVASVLVWWVAARSHG
jgi:hypothetical protein